MPEDFSYKETWLVDLNLFFPLIHQVWRYYYENEPRPLTGVPIHGFHLSGTLQCRFKCYEGFPRPGSSPRMAFLCEVKNSTPES